MREAERVRKTERWDEARYMHVMDTREREREREREKREHLCST